MEYVKAYKSIPTLTEILHFRLIIIAMQGWEGLLLLPRIITNDKVYY
jgi:hypothetical protein